MLRAPPGWATRTAGGTASSPGISTTTGAPITSSATSASTRSTGRRNASPYGSTPPTSTRTAPWIRCCPITCRGRSTRWPPGTSWSNRCPGWQSVSGATAITRRPRSSGRSRGRSGSRRPWRGRRRSPARTWRTWQAGSSPCGRSPWRRRSLPSSACWRETLTATATWTCYW